MNPPPARKIITALRNLVAFHRQIGITTYPRSEEIDRLLNDPHKPPATGKTKVNKPLRSSPRIPATAEGLAGEIDNCRNCPRHIGRKRPVTAAGSDSARLMVVVDYPRPVDETADGYLNNEHGKLFDKMLTAIDLDRSDIYLTAMTRCAPGQDRPPTREECLACQPWLLKEIRLIRPRIILAMGAATAAILAGKNVSLASLRGRFFKYAGIDIIASHPPAALLDREGLKPESWHDLKLLKARLR